MYALTGANGHLGRLVIKHLLTQVPANQIIATTRDPQKLADIASLGVVVRRADFADPTTLAAAYAGATRLLIISTYVVSHSVELHKAAIAGAVAAGVKHIIYTSTPHADPNSTNPLSADHGQTEVALAASGVPWTALRNSFYAEFLKNFLDLLLVKRQLLIPEGSAKHSWIFREDCARAATGALIGKMTITGPVDVTGPEAVSFADLASRLSSFSDHQITAQALPDQEIIAQVTAKGVPADAASSTVRLISQIARESPSTPTDTVERASGTKPTSIDTVLRTLV
ncbi:MAG TPA: NAD(P)H-binding protein [Ktedonobacteraceae bacterium]|nr:NAD(P)H-binding protein [Ktedonobacteraceae bacterium]